MQLITSQDLPALPGYKLLRPLGAGAYGVVFLGTQLSTGEHVAVKLVRVDGDMRRAIHFHRETTLCAKLRHPHIVQLLDKGEAGPYLYGVFQHVPGETLRNHLARQGALGATETAHLMRQVLQALDCMHRARIVHRDLKPDNIMVLSGHGPGHAMVLDFGISAMVSKAQHHRVRAQMTRDEIVGTPSYCSPEQLRGALPDFRSDLYSWGLVFLECLTGAAMLGNVSQTAFAHQLPDHDDFPLPPEIDTHPVGALLRHALHKSTSDRSASAAQLLSELDRTELVGLTRPCTSPGRQHLGARTICSPSEFAAFDDTAMPCGDAGADILVARQVAASGHPFPSDVDTRCVGLTAPHGAVRARRRPATSSGSRRAHPSVRVGKQFARGRRPRRGAGLAIRQGSPRRSLVRHVPRQRSGTSSRRLFRVAT